MEIRECSCKIGHIGSVRLEEEKCELRRCLLPYSWQIMDHIDDSLEGFWHFLVLVFECRLGISHHEERRSLDCLHARHDRSCYDRIDTLALCDTDIEEILLECEFPILSLEFSDLVSLRCILIEYPDIVDPETRDQDDSEHIRLSERQTKILTSHFTL